MGGSGLNATFSTMQTALTQLVDLSLSLAMPLTGWWLICVFVGCTQHWTGPRWRGFWQAVAVSLVGLALVLLAVFLDWAYAGRLPFPSLLTLLIPFSIGALLAAFYFRQRPEIWLPLLWPCALLGFYVLAATFAAD